MPRPLAKPQTPPLVVPVKPDPCRGCAHIPNKVCDVVDREPDEALQRLCMDAGWRVQRALPYQPHSPSTGDHAVFLEVAR